MKRFMILALAMRLAALPARAETGAIISASVADLRFAP